MTQSAKRIILHRAPSDSNPNKALGNIMTIVVIH